MSREIKFRGKRVDNGEWVYGSYFNVGYSNKIVESLWNKEDESHHFRYHDVNTKTVGQYTGLKDKNGKEIYSGTELKIQLPMGGFWGDVKQEKTGVVRYESEKGGFIVEWEHSRNQHHVNLTCDIAFSSEITGPIHNKQ